MTTVNRANLVAETVGSKVAQLQARLQAGSSAAKAEAARLRRAVTAEPGTVPEIWGITMAGVPETLIGRGDEPTPAERAIHTALCLYAIHQQSSPEPMNRAGVGLGSAVRSLAGGGAQLEPSPVLRRFDALTTADSLPEMVWHLRGLITQLRGAGIALDYGRLAADLYRWNWPESRNRVRRAWGRQLYASKPTSSAPEPAAPTN